MADNSAGWYSKNESRRYPLDDTVTAISDAGLLLPGDLIVDLSLSGYTVLGYVPFLSGVTVSRNALTLTIALRPDTIQYVDGDDSTPEDPEGLSGGSASIYELDTAIPFASIAIAKPVKLHTPYELVSPYIANSGQIVFGNTAVEFTGRFSTVAQSRLAASVWRTLEPSISEASIAFPSAFSTRIEHAYSDALAAAATRFRADTTPNGSGSNAANYVSQAYGILQLTGFDDIAVAALPVHSVTTAFGVASPAGPILNSRGQQTYGVSVSGSLARRLDYLPKGLMATEADCSGGGFPPPILTIGGVPPLATATGGHFTLEFDNLEGVVQQPPKNSVDSEGLNRVVRVIPIDSSILQSQLCGKAAFRSAPVLTPCADSSIESCDGVHTFPAPPVAWDYVYDQPETAGAPRTKPGGGLCPPRESIEDELAGDNAAEFAGCYDPIDRGPGICQRWYSRRIWTFDAGVDRTALVVAGAGLYYNPPAWSSFRSAAQVVQGPAHSAFLGMPSRNYIDRTIIVNFQLHPGGSQAWSYGEVYVGGGLVNAASRAWFSISMATYMDTQYTADFAQPPSYRYPPNAALGKRLNFGVMYGEAMGPDTLGDPGVRRKITGYWLIVTWEMQPDVITGPKYLILETADLLPRSCQLDVFGTREVSGALRVDVAYNIGGTTGTQTVRDPGESWAGEDAAVGSQFTARRVYMGFGLGINSRLSTIVA